MPSLVMFLLPAALLIVDMMHDPRKLRIGVGWLIYGLLLAPFLLAQVSQLPIFAVAVFDVPVGGWMVLGLFAFIALGVIVLGVALTKNGVTMVRYEGCALSHLLSLVLGVAILGYVVAAGVAIYLGFYRLMGFLIAIAFPLAWLGTGLLAFLGYAKLYGMWMRRFGRPISAVIVLGAGVPNGEVRPLLASRVRMGMDWQERQAAKGVEAALIMSGGQGPDEPLPEGEAMAKWAVEHGADAERILIEGASTTTEENLRFSAQTMRAAGIEGRAAVVTSNYHAFRAATLMRREGLPGYAIGAPTASYYVPSAMLREYVALLRDHLKLNIVALALSLFPLFLFLRELTHDL